MHINNTVKKPVNIDDFNCVILAAGASQRFGASNKLFATLPNGRSVIEHCISIYLELFKVVYVVVRPENAHKLPNNDAVIVINNHQADNGMSSSITVAVEQTTTVKGWLFCLADMPYVAEETVSSIMQNASESKIVMPMHKGRQGHPVMFGSAYKTVLMTLTGDNGARSVIKQAPQDKRVMLRVDDPGILWDIDTPADIKQH